MCEKNGGLQPNGKCSDDEYCAGPNTLENSVCGKKLLCSKKGISQINFSVILFQGYVLFCVSLNELNFFSGCFKSKEDNEYCGKECKRFGSYCLV